MPGVSSLVAAIVSGRSQKAPGYGHTIQPIFCCRETIEVLVKTIQLLIKALKPELEACGPVRWHSVVKGPFPCSQPNQGWIVSRLLGDACLPADLVLFSFLFPSSGSPWPWKHQACFLLAAESDRRQFLGSMHSHSRALVDNKPVSLWLGSVVRPCRCLEERVEPLKSTNQNKTFNQGGPTGRQQHIHFPPPPHPAPAHGTDALGSVLDKSTSASLTWWWGSEERGRETRSGDQHDPSFHDFFRSCLVTQSPTQTLPYSIVEISV